MHERPEFDAVVIGAGVVGLAVGRALAIAGHGTLVLEQEPQIATAVSARNSGVMHAGIYYPTGSRKASLCVRGQALLYDYAAAREIPHRRLGKFIVATEPAETTTLERYLAQGEANGVAGLSLLDAGELAAREPALLSHGALWSPSSGVIDGQAYARALRADLEAAGGHVLCGAEVVAASLRAAGPHIIRFHQAGEGFVVGARMVINAAGLGAPALASRLEGLASEWIPTAHFARGRYYALRGPAPFKHLVYPVAPPGSLGVHLTLDVDGRARFGPDLEWIYAVDYSFDERAEPAFRAAIARYWPAVSERALVPDSTGIRPKIAQAGADDADFRIDGPELHGVAGLVNLFGIESPGLTASLALAQAVVEALDGKRITDCV